MKKPETLKILVLIESAYPRFRLKSETVERWLSLCREMDFDRVMKNVYIHIRRSPYPPGIAEIAAFKEPKEDFTEKLTVGLKARWEGMERDQLEERGTPVPPWQHEYVPAKRII